MKKQLFKNVIVNIFSVLWRMLIGFVVMPVMVNKLGADKYGVWTLVVSFTIFGYLNLAELGVGTSVIKYVSEYLALKKIKEVNQVISSALIFYFAAGFLASGGLLLFTHFAFFRIFNVPVDLISPTKFLLTLLAIKAFIDFPTQAISSAIEGFQRYDIWRGIEIVRETLRAIAVLTALFLGKGLIVLGFILLGESVFQILASTISLRWIFPKWQILINIPRKVLKLIISYSGKMLGIRVNATVYNGMDKIIIGAVLPIGMLTSYAIASSIHTIANRTVSMISLPLLPTASALNANNDNVRLQDLLLKATKYTLALSIPAVLSLMILAKPFISLWMGEEYISVTPLAQLFLSYLLINALAPVAYNLLLGINKASVLLKIQVISTVINLVVSIVLVYHIGVVGVIWGTVIGTSFAVFPYLIVLFREIKLKWRRFLTDTILKVYPYALLPVIFLEIIIRKREPQSLFEIGIYIILFYIVFFILFSIFGLNKEERKLVVTSIKSLKDKFI